MNNLSIGGFILAQFGDMTSVRLVRAASNAGFTNGMPNAPSLTTSYLYAAVQPATGTQMKQLSELERATEVICAYSLQALLTADIGQQQLADQILWQGYSYTVIKVKNWTAQAGFCESLASRVDNV